MAFVRGQERFVYEQFVQHVKIGLLQVLHYDGSGIVGGGLPWGLSRPLTFVENIPEAKLDVVLPNTLAIAEGTIPDDADLELGGALVEVVHTFFVDIYGETQGIARSIGGDVRSLLNGRAGVPTYRPLLNWADPAKPPLPGHHIRFEDAELSFPGVGANSRVTWAVVKVTLIHEYSP